MEYRKFNNNIIDKLYKGEIFSGHLNKALVSATCEMVVNIIDGEVDRYFDEEVGLNLFKL